jgi:hypothetical protein
MASDGAERLLERLYLAWLVHLGTLYDPTQGDAMVAAKRRELQCDAFNDTLGATVDGLWDYRLYIDDHDVVTKDANIGYSRAQRAVWCRIADLPSIVNRRQQDSLPPKHFTKKAFDLFREKKPFSRMSAHLAKALDDLPATIELSRDAHVLPELIVKATARLERESLTAVVISEIPIAGAHEAILWIGFRTADEIRSVLNTVAPKCSGDSLSNLLRHELSQGQRAAILTFGMKEEEPRGDRATIAHRGTDDANPSPQIEIGDNARFGVVAPGDDLLLQRLLLSSWTVETRDWFRKQARVTAAALTEDIANRFRNEINYAARVRNDTGDICYEHFLKLDDELQNKLTHDGLPPPVVPEAISLNAAVLYDEEYPTRWARRFYGRVAREIISMYDAAFFPVDPDIYPVGFLWSYADTAEQRHHPRRRTRQRTLNLALSALTTTAPERVIDRGRRAYTTATHDPRYQRRTTSNRRPHTRQRPVGHSCRGTRARERHAPAMTTLAQLIDLANQCTAPTGTPRVTIEAVMPSSPDLAFQQSYGGIRAPRVEVDQVDPQFRRKLINFWIKEYRISISNELVRDLHSGFCRIQPPDSKRSAVGVWTLSAMVERLRSVERRDVWSTTVRDILREPYVPFAT